MALNFLPLVLLAGAGFALAGKKKRSSSPAPVDEAPPDEPLTDGEADEGEGTADTLPVQKEYGKVVAKGLRRDKRGHMPWRIKYEQDGYHAELVSNTGPAPVLLEEVGVSASLRGAKELLRDHFNQALLDAGYSESDFKEDPAIIVSTFEVPKKDGDLGGMAG